MRSSVTWIKFSGLPQLITERCGSAGWIIFQDLLIIDQEKNTNPGRIEESIINLHRNTAVDPDQVREALEQLTELTLVRGFIPDNDEEPCLLQIGDLVPHIPTRDAITAAAAGQLDHEPLWRYLDNPETKVPDAPMYVLNIVADLFVNQCGLSRSPFFTDQLNEICVRYPLDRIRSTFKWAEKNNIRSRSRIISAIATNSRVDKGTTLNQPFTVGDKP